MGPSHLEDSAEMVQCAGELLGHGSRVSVPKLLLSGWPIVLACSGSEGDVWSVSIADSSGIAVVTNERGTLPEDPVRWTLHLEGLIGSASGEDVLGAVADAARDSRGRVLILDQQAHAVRIYDADGTFVRDVGREGEGPGEFSDYVNAILVGAADSFYVTDYVQTRISVFSPEGEFVRSISVPPLPLGDSWAWGEDGAFLYRGRTTSRNEQNRFEFWDAVLRFDPDGSGLDTIFVFDYDHTDIGGPGDILVPLIVNSPFWDVLPARNRIVWSATDRAQVLVHGPEGSLERIIRHAAWTHRPTTAADRELLVGLLRQRMEMLGGSAAAVDGLDLQQPERFPAITSIAAGPDNTIWVQRMGDARHVDPWGINAPNRSQWLGGPIWDVLDQQGRFQGIVELPERTRILHVDETRVVAVQQDSLDVERVAIFRMIA